MKVYIITSGCYSDYHIDAVCETFESAKCKCLELTSECSYDDYRIEEWDTKTGECCSNKDATHYHVWWDGAKLTCEESYAVEYTVRASSIYAMRRGHDFEFNIDGLRADDEAHALKIAYDILALYCALLEGI